MQAITAKRVLIFVIAVFSMSLMVGCSGMEKRPEYRSGYLYYPMALVNADRALDEARAAGKDKECPAEFNASKDMVDKAYEVYMACRTQEAIDMAQEAIDKIQALCSSNPVAEKKPEPKVGQKAEEPVVILVSEPKAKEKVIALASEPKIEEKVIVLVFEDVHFDFDKSTLKPEAQVMLKRNLQLLKENPGVNVQIGGHTCAHGAEDYNMALGERRANAVKEHLVNQGIAADRMTTISYGETRLATPEIPTPKNKQSEEAKANRRVHFEVIVK